MFYLDKILSLVTIDDKLPIGFPTSPFISNYIMRKYDINIKSFVITITLFTQDIQMILLFHLMMT